MSDDTEEQGGQEGGGMSAEQGADFAALMAGAEAPGAAQATQAADQQAQEIEAMKAENAQTLEFVWSLIEGLLPAKVAARYGAEQRTRIAESGTVLAIKRGWSMAEFMARWGAEIAFSAALVGPAVPVVLEAIKNRKKAAPDPTAPAKVEQAPQPAQVEQSPGSKTVSFGTVTP
jgi:hypothetical protein